MSGPSGRMVTIQDGRKPEPTLDAILQRMRLTNPGDKALLLKLLPWIQTQRPKFMYTSVLSIAVLLQRMARAFSMRSSAPGTKNGAGVRSGRPSPTSSDGRTLTHFQPTSNATGGAPLSQQQLQKPKRKSFRSAKKLDLSPNVVYSLKGFVADLAATIPLILEYVAIHVPQDKSNSGGIPLTAVDTIEVCLHMMEGEVATNQPGTDRRALPNAAMDLYRKILDRAISNKPPNQDGMASTMDQLKFKTFSVKTLESAQSRAIAVVESLYDFRLLWSVSHEQHSLAFVPRAGNSQQQEELAWKLAFYIVWRRQEENPNLCSRKERILAATASMLILCVFPLLHDGPQQAGVNDNNKRPMEQGDSSPAAKVVRVGSNDGDVHQGSAAAAAAPGKDRYSLRQERVIGVVMHASKHASSFLKWAQPAKDPSSETNGTEIERKEVEQELLKVVKELAAFSKFGGNLMPDSNNWMKCLKSALGIHDTDHNNPSWMDTAEKNLLNMLEDAFSALQHDEDERMGTRVEAVPYIEELRLMKEVVQKGYHKHLCKTTNDRQTERNELIACVPLTSRLMGDKNTTRRGSSDSANISEYQAKAMKPRLIVMEDSASDLVSPPVMTESMELGEWTIAVLSSLTTVQPSPNLLSLLDPDPNTQAADGTKKLLPILTNVIVPLLNRFLRRMQQASGGSSRDPMPMIVEDSGKVQTHHRSQDTQLWAAIVQLYYHALESILFFEKGAANSPATKSAPLHEALMACSYLCVARAVSITGKMELVQPENHQIYSILPIVGSTPYTYLKLTESFVRALTSTIPGNETSNQLQTIYGKFPRILQNEVNESEVHVIESLLWVRDNSRSMSEGCIVNTVAELKQASYWPPECLEATLPEELEDGVGTANNERPHPNNAEFVFVSFVMQKLLKISYFRIQAICNSLSIPATYPVASQVWLAFRFLLRNQVELLYGRHVDQWILCTIHGICKVMKYQPDITFGKAIKAYTSLRGNELGISTCEAIVRHVKILDAAGDSDGNEGTYGTTKMGNIVNLYNLVFVPIMKSYLLHSKALKRDAATLKLRMSERSTTGSTGSRGGMQSANAPVSKSVQEGNVKIELTMGGEGTRNLEQKENQTQGGPSDPSYSTFLQFGAAAGAKRLSQANEMIQASRQ